MNILKFLAQKLVAPAQTISRDQLDVAKGNEDNTELLKKFGIVTTDLRKAIEDQTLVMYERSQIYQTVDRSLNHPLMSAAAGMFAEVACLTADTKIPLLDGRILTILEILEEYKAGKENWVYSCTNQGKPKAEKILWAVEQPKQKETLRVWLDNEEYVEASINHRFIRRDGTLCRADELKVGESLMPFHRTTYFGYQNIFDNLNKVWEATHQFVVRDTVGLDVKKSNEGKNVCKDDSVLVIHHKDFNKLNNSPNNLPVMKVKEHIAYHGDNVRLHMQDPEHIKLVSENSTRSNKERWANASEDDKKRFWQAGVKARQDNGFVVWNKGTRKTRVCKQCGKVFKVFRSKSQYCSLECSYESKKRRKESVCGICDKVFEHLLSEKRKYCSRLCADKAKSVEMLGNKFREHSLQPSHNHKITKIEVIGEQTVYDITVSGSHLFALDCGIYVHNTTRSQLQESTVWVTAKNKEYQYQIEKMFDIINLEEVIYDWAWTIAVFGDLFVQVFGQPGIGIVSINDDQHPVNVSRVDYNGRLIGFYETPMGYAQADERKLLTPWDYVHLRLLGAKKRRPMYADPQYCLKGDTQIQLLNGTNPTIKEMVENRDKYIGKELWSINPRTQGLEVDTIIDAKKTRLNAQLVRVHLDNDEYIDCTPDHKFMLRDGTFKEAELLDQGESLMPLYSKFVGRNKKMGGYKTVYNPKDGKYHFEHRLVHGKITRGNVVHHKDYNPKNNESNNLETKTIVDHAKLHQILSKHLQKLYKNPTLKALYHKKQKEGRQKAYANSKFRVYCSELISKASLEHWQNPEYRNKTLKAIKKSITPVVIQKRAQTLRETLKNPEIRKKYSHIQTPESKKKQQDNWLDDDFRLKMYQSHRDDCQCFRCKSLRRKGVLLNHKVLKVEWLVEREDTYDITTAKNHNFPTGAGVFVHNSEFRTISIMTPDVRRLTSKYGTSVLADALPIWKRLRLTEDSILMARINKTPTRYIYKITIPEGNANAESVANLIDQYISELKRARALNVDEASPSYQDRFQGLGALEDIIVPVWGNSDNFNIEKIGGEVDIRWIVDVEELRNQLATALKVPLGLLSGYSKEGNPGGLGQNSVERLDIRFARQARRVQRSIQNGLTRLAQIHLAYQGMNPDLNLFEIHMAETSTAEEEELKDALDKGVDIADKLFEFYAKILGADFDARECAEYINKKFLKLNDADLDAWVLKGNKQAFAPREEEPVPGVETPPARDDFAAPAEGEGEAEAGGASEFNPFKESNSVSDLKSALPMTSKKVKLNEGTDKETDAIVGSNEEWDKNWKDLKIKIEPSTVPKPE